MHTVCRTPPGKSIDYAYRNYIINTYVHVHVHVLTYVYQLQRYTIIAIIEPIQIDKQSLFFVFPTLTHHILLNNHVIPQTPISYRLYMHA